MPTKSSDSRSSSPPVRIPPSSSLVTHETNVRELPAWVVPTNFPAPAPADFIPRLAGATKSVRPATRRESAFRHGGWAESRAKVEKALETAGVPIGRQERFRQCGAGCQLMLNTATGERKLVASYCRDRFCVPCGNARGFTIANHLVKMCGNLDIRFLTLGVRSFGLSLTDALDKLNTGFKRLRRSFLWETHVKGGAAFIEVKRGKNSGNWHCHLHILCHGRYLDQRELSNAWHLATGDSFIADIRLVHDLPKVAGYVTKYVAKPLDPSVFVDPLDLVECVLSLRGRRLCSTFGDWRGVELEEREWVATDWHSVGRLDDLLRLCEMGDSNAIGCVKWVRVTGWGNGPNDAAPA